MFAFAHISDLHFSDVLANTQKNGAWHQGPHDLTYCLALPTVLDRVRAQLGWAEDDPLNVVVSGDITRAGAVDEFAVAHLFLRDHSRFTRDPVAMFGLGVSDDRLGCVPGNHDQWNGKAGYVNFIRGVPTRNHALSGMQFRPTAWKKVWTTPDGSMGVEVFGIDSSSDISSRRNYFQRGSISDAELTRLDELLREKRTEGCARAVVCHHSISFNSWYAGKQALDVDSRRRLVQICRRHGVTAILTGHTHDFGFLPLHSPAQAAAGELWELRSASTLAASSTSSNGQPGPVPGFLLHSIRSTHKSLVWRAQQFAWGPAGFTRTANAFKEIPVL